MSEERVERGSVTVKFFSVGEDLRVDFSFDVSGGLTYPELVVAGTHALICHGNELFGGEYGSGEPCPEHASSEWNRAARRRAARARHG